MALEEPMSGDGLQRAALDHLWLHFTDMGGYADPADLQVMVRGDGCYLEDSAGRRYLDALAGLFCVNIGYGFGEEMGEAAAAQMRELPFAINWTFAQPSSYPLELVKDEDTRTTFSEDECDHLLRGFLSPRLFERGLLCRADDRGEPIVQISPPLVARQEQFDEIVEILGGVLDEASDRMAAAT
jgi:adenosylmethionine-8-amino-7-oxononanoate aminotransferase